MSAPGRPQVRMPERDAAQSGPARAPHRPIRVGGSLTATFERRADGAVLIRSTEPMREPARRLTDRLEHFARTTPDVTLVAKRGPDGQWVRITYAQMLARAQAVGQALVQRGLDANRPIVILSDNDLEHFTLAMAAQWVGVPYAPLSAAYSTVSQDFSKLKPILATLEPGLVFASKGEVYARAIAACVAPQTEVVLTEGADGLAKALREAGGGPRVVTPFTELLNTVAGPQAAAAHERVGPDTIAKFLFTSGSTKNPKGVINTQRMICASLQQNQQCFDFMREEPPILVDWLPWNHTFGGNHNTGIVIYNGGTLYIDDGRPTPAGIAETIRNLREIAPTMYYNVPRGFEELARAMVHDEVLRRNLFSRVKGFMYAGAGLSQAVWDLLESQAVATVGERIRMFTGLGMTEMSPSCTFALSPEVRSGHIGLPVPGVEGKLVPVDGKLEARFRGPNQMPGYWKLPEETAAAFDEEGYYRTGDAVVFLDPSDPTKGMAFDGRIAEDFKLSSGTFVNVGPLRSKIILAGDPLVQDVVVAGINRSDLGLLIFPRVDDARRLFGLDASLPPARVLAEPQVRAFFQALLDRMWREGTGSATRPARAMLLVEPPSIDRGEVTDKGSINQRAVLSHRAALVERMYAEGDDPEVLRPRA